MNNTDPTRDLWATVLTLVIRDLASGSVKGGVDRMDAERWIGQYPSQDFRYVVTNAGFDPKTVWRWCRNFMMLPLAARKKFVRKHFFNLNTIHHAGHHTGFQTGHPHSDAKAA